MKEIASPMLLGSIVDKKSLGSISVQIIRPIVEDFWCSIKGYVVGNAIPSPQKKVENHIGRHRAMPHIKYSTMAKLLHSFFSFL